MSATRIGFFLTAFAWGLLISGGTADEPEWWSFRAPQRAKVPTVKDGVWQGNPVDAFLFQHWTENKLRPAALANKRVLLRRAYYDLHGLPPTPEQIAIFLKDESPDAYRRLIDNLLDSPRYGEKWGRHWLDVVRYSDTGGFETDIYFPNAWRYRDYVIKSFNDDKPYDQFIKEQIAADQFWPDDLELRGGFDIPKKKQQHLEARIGTTVFTIGPVYHEAALNGQQLRYEWLTDVVDTTGEAFLGLTLTCSRCHHHKFDELTQRDYHRMMAVFANSTIRNVPVVHKMSEFGFYSSYPKLLRVEELKGAINRIDAAARQRAIGMVKAKFSSESVAAHNLPAKQRTPRQAKLAADIDKALSEAGLRENANGARVPIPLSDDEQKQRDELVKQLGQAALKTRFQLPTATVLAESEVKYPVHMSVRGDWKTKGAKVTPGFPAALTGGKEVSLQAYLPQVSPKHPRKALALWLTNPKHPLTARVMVNRIWQGHFVRGIVATPNNFGVQGGEPSHPALLDWLATEFIRKGWSIKHMHRLIMTSRAYRMSSHVNKSNASVDGQNYELWRMNRRRLQAETIRDAILAVSGNINLKMGGKAVVPPLSGEEKLGMWALDQWPVSLDDKEHQRRSVYIYVKRAFPYPLFTTFDAPDTSVSCGRRVTTTVAPQALTLLNSQFLQQQATVFAKRLQRQAGGDVDRLIRQGWELALGRAPSTAELAKARSLFAESADNEAKVLRGARNLALVLFNLNEFIYVD